MGFWIFDFRILDLKIVRLCWFSAQACRQVRLIVGQGRYRDPHDWDLSEIQTSITRTPDGARKNNVIPIYANGMPRLKQQENTQIGAFWRLNRNNISMLAPQQLAKTSEEAKKWIMLAIDWLAQRSLHPDFRNGGRQVPNRVWCFSILAFRTTRDPPPIAGH